jgi:SprT-like family
MKHTPSMARQAWLEKATKALRELFARKGYKVPAAVRISVGWPKGTHGAQHTIGQCWSIDASSDQHNEIFVSPEVTLPARSLQVMGILAHELVHATIGNKAGHGPAFKACATKIGLTGKMTATSEGAEFKAFAENLFRRIGLIPAGRINFAKGRKVQTTRLLKCECGTCGYTARVTRKWIVLGTPICPRDREPMVCAETDDNGKEL